MFFDISSLALAIIGILLGLGIHTTIRGFIGKKRLKAVAAISSKKYYD
jgi:hypothetical protein